MVFGRKLALGCTLRVASKLVGGVVERDSFKSRDILKISRGESISPLCLG